MTITDRANGDGPGLVLEGSALWPDRVAGLTVPGRRAAGLTADDAVLREWMHASARYGEATDEERHLVDRFLARAERFQVLMTRAVACYGLTRVDASHRSVTEVMDADLTAVGGHGC